MLDRETIKPVLKGQAMFILPVVLLSGWFLGWVGMLAALFGGLVALINLLLLARRLDQTDKASRLYSFAAAPLYLGALERFVFAGVAFAVGIGLLKLAPLALLGGFAAAKAGHLFVQVRRHAAEPIPAVQEI